MLRTPGNPSCFAGDTPGPVPQSSIVRPTWNLHLSFEMKTDRQPFLLPKATGKPPALKRHRLGCFTKFGLVVIALLLLAQIWDDLRSATGRRELLAKAMALLSSVDTYIFGGVLLVNSLLYALMIRYLYPTGADTRSAVARAIVLLKADDFDPQSKGSEIKHFFLIFVLPVLFFGAGTVEYQLLKAWLHGP